MLRLLLRLMVVCERSPSGALWSVFGASREHSHVLLDSIAAQCTSELVSEEFVKELFIRIAGTELIEDNGRWRCVPLIADQLALSMTPLVPLFLQLLPLVSAQSIEHYYTLFIGLFSSRFGGRA